MTSFGKKLRECREEKGFFQAELANQIDAYHPIIGKYERDEAKPSIEAAAKMADILEVSLDYLVGATDIEPDKKTLNRILELQKLPEDVKDKLFYFIDMSIRNFKAKQAYGA